MTGLEIVKMWNANKGTKYPFTSNGGDSSIVRKIKGLTEVFDEQTISDYYVAMLNENYDDIWQVSMDYKVRSWVANKPKAEEVKQPEVNANNNAGLNILGALSKEIVALMGNELASNIGKQVEAQINNYVSDKVVMKVVEYKGEQKKVEGIAHEKFETILKYVAMNEPVMLSGSAGTGKNVIAKQVAEALGLQFYFSNAVTQEYKITGYGDANGEYVKTQFFDAFTKGGLFLLDEMDASCPEALIVLNCAIANGYFDFPVLGRMEAHPDFRVMANANTYGTGATMEYVGRNQLDGATLNRFAIVEVDYDKRIEDNVCPDKDIADFCRAFRNICRKMEYITSLVIVKCQDYIR